MTQSIRMFRLNPSDAGRIIMAALLSVLLIIPYASFDFPGYMMETAKTAAPAEKAAACTPPGAEVTGSRTCTLSNGMQVTAVDTVGSSVEINESVSAADGSVTGTIRVAEGYKIASVKISAAGKGGALSGTESFFAPVTDDTHFSFQPPSGSDRFVVTPFALSTKVWDGSVDVSWYDPSAKTYNISEPAQLAGLAALINGMVDADTPQSMIKGNASYIKAIPHDNVMLVGAGGGNVSDRVYTSEIDFAYKTVYLTADIDMGGRRNGDSWSGPNYTPVGGKFSIDTDMVNGDSFVLDTRFNGIFDGQGHTVKNIYCERYSDKGFPYSMAVGLVGYLGGGSNVSGISGTFKDGWTPAVRNVIVGEGYIRGRRMVGGVVGRVGDASNGVIIESCANHASVMNTDAKGVGGILGSSSGKGVIRNCYNTGSVSTTYSCPAGGIIGANAGMDIYNCYNVGTINSNGAKRGRGIGGHDRGAYKITNAYTLKGSDDDPESKGYFQGSSRRITVEVTEMDAAQMKSDALLNALNVNGQAFTKLSGANNGYPVLMYEASGYPSGSYTVSVKQTPGGQIGTDVSEAAAPGQTVNLTAVPEKGYKLSHFTVNGNPIKGNFYVATANMEISAVFAPVKFVQVKIPGAEDFSIVVTATGSLRNGDAMVPVKNHPIRDGATVMEDTVLLVRAHIYSDAVPAGKGKEYSGTFRYDASNAVKLSVGKYTVTGEGPVEITITPDVRDSTATANADTSWFSPKENVFMISTPDQLAGLAALVNDSNLSFKGKTIRLDKDISLAGGAQGSVWKAIGSSAEKAFSGTFDGQGHVIGGMNAVSPGSSTALFGYCTDATIKNLTVRGESVNKAGMAYAAGIVSYAKGCSISNCVNRVNVTADGEIAGGIAAYTMDGTVIRDCQNYGKITAATGAGGIAGICQGASDVISGCVNTGAISTKGSGLSGLGGIAGKHVGLIENCINAGEIAGNDRYVGGIAGYTSGRKTSKITASQNQGPVTSDSDNEKAALGGVIGYAQFGAYSRSSNTGAVSAGSRFRSQGVGGFIGRPGNEPDLSTAEECVYSKGSYGFAVNGGDYKGVSESDNVEKLAYTTIPDPGDPAAAGSAAHGKTKRVPEICGGITVDGGSHYLVNYAAGELRIAPGASVQLIGTDRILGALTIVAGEGASVTLQDVEFTGDDILLKYEGNGTLILKGRNRLAGLSDASDNVTPTIYAGGNLTVDGTGFMKAEAAKSNSCVKINPGHTLTLKGGLLSVNKKELLGKQGGAVFANGGTVNIAGGSVEGITSSDNVSVISADTVNVISGSVNVKAIRSPKTIDAKNVNVTGGIVRASGHTGNSAKVQESFFGGRSIPNLKGKVNFYSETGAFGKAALSSQNIIVDGAPVKMEIYNIDGNNYFKLRDFAALMSGTKSEFSVDFDTELRAMYSLKGVKYKAVGGEMLSGEDKSSSCVPSNWTLYVNGKLVNCKVYNIGGNNFFKLRDLSGAFGVEVSYDAAKNTAVIRS